MDVACESSAFLSSELKKKKVPHSRFNAHKVIWQISVRTYCSEFWLGKSEERSHS